MSKRTGLSYYLQGLDPVTARIVRAMAYSRVQFRNKVEEHLSGGLLEHYKAVLAEKNGLSKWVDHWKREVEQLVGVNLFVALTHPINGFSDRRPAFDEVVASVRSRDASFRRGAYNQVCRDFARRKLKVKLDDADAGPFWARVEQTWHDIEADPADDVDVDDE